MHSLKLGAFCEVLCAVILEERFVEDVRERLSGLLYPVCVADGEARDARRVLRGELLRHAVADAFDHGHEHAFLLPALLRAVQAEHPDVRVAPVVDPDVPAFVHAERRRVLQQVQAERPVSEAFSPADACDGHHGLSRQVQQPDAVVARVRHEDLVRGVGQGCGVARLLPLEVDLRRLHLLRLVQDHAVGRRRACESATLHSVSQAEDFPLRVQRDAQSGDATALDCTGRPARLWVR